MDLSKQYHQSFLPIVKKLGLQECVKGQPLHRSLRIYPDNISARDPIEVYYAPFESNLTKKTLANIRVFFIGLTPGIHQARAAYHEYFHPNPEGKDGISFLGSMRSNLVKLMDALGLPRSLKIETTRQLFEDSSKAHLADSTSLLRFPVFNSGKNYSGSPKPDEHPFLTKMVKEIFTPVMGNVGKETLIVPLGVRVDEQLRLVAKSLGPGFEKRCLLGFPHTSGANNGRIAEYLEGDLSVHRNQIRNVLGD